MSSPEYLIYRQRRGRVQNTDQVGRHVHLVASRVEKKPVATRFGEDQLKLASLSSGVEVALVVSASINWGKRCPHFLAETRPPFFATSLRANGKNGPARRRGKKNTFFFAAAPLVVRSPKKKPHRLSAFACEESDDEKRKARDGQRRRASRRTRAIFFTRIRAFARKIARFAKKPPFAAAVAGASSSAERVVFRRGASLELFAPCVRPRARPPCSRRLRRRNTPAQKIVLEQVFFTNRSLEASWVNSVRSSPRRVVVSAPFKKKTRAPVGQKWKIDAFVAFERHLRWIRGEGARGDERAASPPSPLPARAPPPPPCGRK